MGIEGLKFEERARNFTKKARDTQWTTMIINDYLRSQRERAENKEIADSSVPSYYGPIKLFLKMNDIILNWKKISRRIPRGSSHAKDKTPTKDEIRKILTYPDRLVFSLSHPWLVSCLL